MWNNWFVFEDTMSFACFPRTSRVKPLFLMYRYHQGSLDTCWDGSIDVKKIKSSTWKRRISGLFRRFGFEARLLKKLGFLIWKHIYREICVSLQPRIRCHDLRQWIRCQAFGDDFWKMKKGDNQSGNSTILGGCRQWNRCQGEVEVAYDPASGK